ncbi:VOC family protein [Spirosoma validum]|uniref:VOC family protein n=1 Tax=Spirosoma validum TaxID=2771355 RepID=A0A927B087_9BACT|nr:VOC family protein [Spirosoma validum]MBD2753030.1 VOC family protein [Spirosoma validum]
MDKTMEQRLSVITLGVDDLAAMKQFYSEIIGWPTVAENKDIVFYTLNGFLFSLFGRTSLAKGAGLAPEGSGFRSFTLAYNVPTRQEVDHLFEELKKKNVHMLGEPQNTPFGGYFFYFTDPESNVLEVAYNPYIPLDEQGNVITHNSIDDL